MFVSGTSAVGTRYRSQSPAILNRSASNFGRLPVPVNDARVRHERRLDLRVAVLRRVQVQHEVDQRAREARAGTDQHGEPRARDLRAALEVDDAERRTEIPVRLRREVERARRAMSTHFDVVGAALPDRHALVRQIGNRQQPAIASLLDGVELDARVCLICCARARLAS